MRWVIIIIVAVFDPLAIMMVLAATESLQWHRSGLVARLRNGQPVTPTDPVKTQDKDPGYERKLIDFVDGMAQSGRGLAQRIQSRFKRKEPVSQPVPQTTEPASPEPTAAGPVEPVQPNDEPIRENDLPVANAVPDSQPVQDPVIENTVENIAPDRLDSDYITYNGKLWRREALMAMHPELWNAKLRLTEDTDPVNVRFGVDWPKFANKGDQFLRVDYLPTKLFKYNGRQWIEIDKNSTDTYSYDNDYINYLIEKISSGEYDPELLSEGEKAQLADVLKRDVTLKK